MYLKRVLVMVCLAIIYSSRCFSQESVAGVWFSDFGVITFTQTRTAVEGTYTCCEGTIVGNLKGKQLHFTWEDPIYGKGWGVFTLSEDGNRLAGEWGSGDKTVALGQWNAVRYQAPSHTGTPSYWTVTGKNSLVGELSGKAVMYVSDRGLSGELHGVYTVAIQGRTQRLDVFNYLEGLAEGDRLRLRWTNPLDGSTGTMTLASEGTSWLGKWKTDDHRSSGDIGFHAAPTGSGALFSEGLNAILDQKQALREGMRHYHEAFQLDKEHRYAQAAHEYERAVSLLKQAGAVDKLALAYGGLAALYHKQSRFERAQTYYRKVLELGPEVGEFLVEHAHAMLQLICYDLGHLDCGAVAGPSQNEVEAAGLNPLVLLKFELYDLYNAKKFGKIERTYQERLPAILETMTLSPADYQTLYVIEIYAGQANLALEQNSKSLKHYQKALEAADTIGDKGIKASLLPLMAEVHLRMKEPEKAKKTFLEAIKIQEGFHHSGIYLTYMGIADLYAKNPRPGTDWARHYYEKMIEALEKVTEEVRQNPNKKSFVEFNEFYYAKYIKYLAGKEDPNADRRALEIAEMARSRAFAELIVERSLGGLRPELPQPATIAQIQHTARRLQAPILEYFVLDSFLMIWFVAPDGEILAAKVPVASKDLEHLIQTVISAWSGRDKVPQTTKGEGRGSIPFDRVSVQKSWDKAAAELSRVLFPDKIRGVLEKTAEKRVVLVPHRGLATLPMTALPNPGKGLFLESYACQRVPGIGVLLKTEALLESRKLGKLAAGDFLLFGDPILPKLEDLTLRRLAGSRKEVEEIGKRFNAEYALDQASSEANFKKLAPQKRIIHLATHGILYETSPLNSFMALAPGEGQDGKLTATEILGMRFAAGLVVLSACDTGLGEVTGDGVDGLARSFMVSGVPSVLVSLWQVDDEATAVLMQAFYAYLNQGEDLAAALQKAQADVRQEPIWRHPYFWAAFVLYGERG